jgi:DNA invertase Pin-like site-specific DNA recombinase
LASPLVGPKHGFVSLTEALDLTTPAGRAMAGLLAVFAEFEKETLRERVRAGLAQVRQNGQRMGRKRTGQQQSARLDGALKHIQFKLHVTAQSARPGVCGALDI